MEEYLGTFGLLNRQSVLIYACGHPGMIEDVKVKAAALEFLVQEERFWKE